MTRRGRMSSSVGVHPSIDTAARGGAGGAAGAGVADRLLSPDRLDGAVWAGWRRRRAMVGCSVGTGAKAAEDRPPRSPPTRLSPPKFMGPRLPAPAPPRSPTAPGEPRPPPERPLPEPRLPLEPRPDPGLLPTDVGVPPPRRLGGRLGAGVAGAGAAIGAGPGTGAGAAAAPSGPDAPRENGLTDRAGWGEGGRTGSEADSADPEVTGADGVGPLSGLFGGASVVSASEAMRTASARVA
jgi:hypothetical protein